MVNDIIDFSSGSRYTVPDITPKSYSDKKKFDPQKPWAIQYRYYSLQGEVLPVQTRAGLNKIKDWEIRKEVAEALRDQIEYILSEGFDPIRKETPIQERIVSEIGPNSSLIEGFEFALTKAQSRVSAGTFEDSIVVVRFMREHVLLTDIKLAGITRKSIVKVLERIENAKIRLTGKFSNNNYNHFRKYIGILFRDLVQHELVESNPVTKELLVRPVIKRYRKVLSMKERDEIKIKVAETFPEFFRYIQIFFHSGARNTELFRVKGRHVNLDDQYYLCTILKGGQYMEVPKAIKTIALPYWIEAMKNCTPNDYLFSEGLLPGAIQISPAQVTRRWRDHIKTKLNIQADLYSLKHSNTQEVSRILGIEAAAQHNSHTSTKITVKHYEHEGERNRTINSVKEMQNVFFGAYLIRW